MHFGSQNALVQWRSDMSTWILLRGLTRDSRHWGAFPDLLNAAMPDLKIITVDIAGNGSRHDERSPLSIARMVEDCRCALPVPNVESPINILAMSLGAMVALDWAVRYPDEIRHCVLINTSLRGYSPFYHRLLPRNYWRLALMASTRSSTHWEASVLAMTSQIKPSGTLDHWISLHQAFPVGKCNALRQLWAAARFNAPIQRPPCHMLLLASTHDNLVNVECSRTLAKNWQLPLVEHPFAGHDLPLDDGTWVIDQLKNWSSLQISER